MSLEGMIECLLCSGIGVIKGLGLVLGGVTEDVDCDG